MIPNGTINQNSKISNEQIDHTENYGNALKKISNDIEKEEDMNSNTSKLSENVDAIFKHAAIFNSISGKTLFICAIMIKS